MGAAILLAFTGRDLPSDLLRFVGTVQTYDGLVIHLWDATGSGG